MLSSESLEVGEMLQAAMRGRYGDAGSARAFRAFDTICSATQDRQDAVKALLDERTAGPDGRDWRPQQQQHVQLARICATRATYHIADPEGVAVERGDPAQAGRFPSEVTTAGVAAVGNGDHRSNVGRIDARQSRRRGDSTPRTDRERLIKAQVT